MIPSTVPGPTQRVSRDNAYKVVVVGDADVGKSWLQHTLIATLVGSTQKVIPLESREADGSPAGSQYQPTIFQSRFASMPGSSERAELTFGLWDVASHPDYDLLRALNYNQANVVVICFSVTHPHSFENISTKWIKEIRHWLPEVPVLLVGTKSDLRSHRDTNVKLKSSGQSQIFSKKAEQLVKKINVTEYIECSAVTGDGVQDLALALFRIFKTQPSATTPTTTMTPPAKMKRKFSLNRGKSKKGLFRKNSAKQLSDHDHDQRGLPTTKQSAAHDPNQTLACVTEMVRTGKLSPHAAIKHAEALKRIQVKKLGDAQRILMMNMVKEGNISVAQALDLASRTICDTLRDSPIFPPKHLPLEYTRPFPTPTKPQVTVASPRMPTTPLFGSPTSSMSSPTSSTTTTPTTTTTTPTKAFPEDLFAAIAAKSVVELMQAIRRGVNVNYVNRVDAAVWSGVSSGYVTALGYAARLNFQEGVKLLLDEGVAVDEMAGRVFPSVIKHTPTTPTHVNTGATALMEAAATGAEECAHMLLNAGANPCRKTVVKGPYSGLSSIGIAERHGHKDVALLLRDFSTNFSTSKLENAVTSNLPPTHGVDVGVGDDGVGDDGVDNNIHNTREEEVEVVDPSVTELTETLNSMVELLKETPMDDDPDMLLSLSMGWGTDDSNHKSFEEELLDAILAIEMGVDEPESPVPLPEFGDDEIETHFIDSPERGRSVSSTSSHSDFRLSMPSLLEETIVDMVHPNNDNDNDDVDAADVDDDNDDVGNDDGNDDDDDINKTDSGDDDDSGGDDSGDDGSGGDDSGGDGDVVYNNVVNNIGIAIPTTTMSSVTTPTSTPITTTALTTTTTRRTPTTTTTTTPSPSPIFTPTTTPPPPPITPTTTPPPETTTTISIIPPTATAISTAILTATPPPPTTTPTTSSLSSPPPPTTTTTPTTTSSSPTTTPPPPTTPTTPSTPPLTTTTTTTTNTTASSTSRRKRSLPAPPSLMKKL